MAHCYIVTYDLRGSNKDYNSLYSAIRTYSRWGRVTENTWAVVSESSAVDIRNHLMRYIDSDDRLMVLKYGGAAAWRNTLASSEWLRTNLI